MIQNNLKNVPYRAAATPILIGVFGRKVIASMNLWIVS